MYPFFEKQRQSQQKIIKNDLEGEGIFFLYLCTL